ncbi:somatostatin receptor type 1 isoform X1 [Nycticebus coucang]|uniref:somatostatin receptor type 1 isoform X1 n=2 Tax=Nycticebus coucang TaxID=9470 RepID=UPI00234C9140|nr:somatostatin receptor type 1 isoform X1 [Nycticebus coucang]
MKLQTPVRGPLQSLLPDGMGRNLPPIFPLARPPASPEPRQLMAVPRGAPAFWPPGLRARQCPGAPELQAAALRKPLGDAPRRRRPSPGSCGEGGGSRGPGAGAADGMEEPGRNASQNGTLSEGQGSAILISFIYSVVCLVGLCGNSMVIYVILRYAKMKTATNIYILNLAIADELLMLSVPFLVTSTLLRHWPFGALLCRLVLSVDAVNMFTSIYCLTVLSVDRYVAVVHPIKAARYRRPTVAKVVNLGVWVLSLLVILPIVVFSRTAANSDGTVACNMLMPEPAQRWLVGFVLYTFLMGFLLPVGAICLCYVLIIAKMRMVALKAGWQQRKRSERKITLMVMMVVMVFVICWMPFYVVQLVNVFAEQDDATVSQLSVILGYANSCANPILYGFLSDNFKRSFQRILCLSWMDNAAEEPVDYYATALKSRAYSVEDFQPENLESGGVFRNGTCTSRITTL